MGEKIAKNLRLIRKMKGLSQTEFGKLIGVTGQMIQKYESGQSQVSPLNLKKLAASLEVDIRQFFDAGESYVELADETTDAYAVALDDKTKELLRAFATLTQDDKDRLIAMAEALATLKKD